MKKTLMSFVVLAFVTAFGANLAVAAEGTAAPATPMEMKAEPAKKATHKKRDVHKKKAAPKKKAEGEMGGAKY